MKENIYEVLKQTVTPDYAAYLVENDEFMKFIMDDIKTESAYNEGYYSVSDIKYAIGRAICWKFGIAC